MLRQESRWTKCSWPTMVSNCSSSPNWTDGMKSHRISINHQNPASTPLGTARHEARSKLLVLRGLTPASLSEDGKCLVRCVVPILKRYAMLRNAKLDERSYHKVVMWTGGSYAYDDVNRSSLGLDRPETTMNQSQQSHTSVL